MKIYQLYSVITLAILAVTDYITVIVVTKTEHYLQPAP